MGRLIDADDLLTDPYFLDESIPERTMFIEAVEDSEIIDPIHAAGGCYCRECEYRYEFFNSRHFLCAKARCETCGAESHFVEDDDFCRWGRKKE